MRVQLPWGRGQFEFDLPDEQFHPLHQGAAPTCTDPVAALGEALEHPVHFPPLRRALTPDDHIAIVVDESVPRLPQLLGAILEHLQQAGISPEAVTLVCLPPSTGQSWLEELPDTFQDVRVEIHDPGQRKNLSYLATTKKGRRIYLNRTTVDADQAIILGRRDYDCLHGYAGGEGTLFPALSDEATRQETAGHFSFAAPQQQAWPLRQEAQEVAWLLGMPFFIQVIEGRPGEIVGLVAGPVDSTRAGQALLDARWRVEVDQAVDVVVAGIPGEDASFHDLARAFASAARIVRPGGKIALLTAADPDLGPGAERLRRFESPDAALPVLAAEKPPDHEACFLWVRSALHAKLYLLSRWDDELAEEMFAVPLQKPEQVEKFISKGESCAVLPEAQRTLAVARGNALSNS